METVQPKNSLADHIVINTLKNDLVKYIESIPNYTSSKYTKSGTMKFSNLEILKFHGTIFDINTTLRLKQKDGTKI